MDEIAAVIRSLNLETGKLCLDFANTADWHASDHPEEHLNNYSDLIVWAHQVNLLSGGEAQQLLQEATRRSGEAALAFERAIALREAIYRIFSATTHGQPPAAADLSLLNDILPAALSKLQLDYTADGFTWRWSGNSMALDWLLWPLAQSAAALLTAEDLERVGECADDRGCGYLFYDTSRNRSRRWCDMKSCGNRAKAQHYYERQQAAGG